MIREAKEKFYDAILNNSMEELVRSMYEITGLPTLINDELGNNLACSPVEPIGDPDYDHLIDENRSTQEHFSRFYQKYISGFQAKQYPILINDGDKKAKPQLFSIIWANGFIVGYTAVLLNQKEAEPDLVETVRLFNASVRSVIVYQKDKARTNEQRGNHVFNYLLTVRDIHTEDFIGNASNLGMRHPGPYLILRVKCEHQGLEDVYTPLLFMAVRRRFPNMIYTDLDEGFYFLLGDFAGQKVKELIDDLKAALSGYPIHISSSLPFHDITLIRGYYQQAKQTMVIGLKLSSHLFYYRATYYMPLQIYSFFAESNEIDPYINPVMKRILEHDKEKSTEYYFTLWIYLYCFMNVKEAARMLNVHVNTLHYRLDRMSELFGIDYKDYYMLNTFLSDFGLIYASKGLYWKDMEPRYLLGHKEEDINRVWFKELETSEGR